MNALQTFKKHGAHYYEGDEQEIIDAMEEYAEYMAIEFSHFIYKNCEEVDGGVLYKGETHSINELYKIFKQNQNDKLQN
jgi:hypothetical protein